MVATAHVSRVSTLKKNTLDTYKIISLTVNNTGLSKGHLLCFLWGTNSTYTYHLDEIKA
jgi:hypothetical protein